MSGQLSVWTFGEPAAYPDEVEVAGGLELGGGGIGPVLGPWRRPRPAIAFADLVIDRLDLLCRRFDPGDRQQVGVRTAG